ncbi:hypothetical protein RE628_26800 [Paenibacillus sp. D2_2]|uniref:hypothetical protein n=1 Tax=Paenibacillus sp. D2_2 TaxID=3073092 RepID=UPI002815DE8F|nr:hypothetical protein [Paenibacillus sp. D2_2]WMT40698.1 hypothetical protein RE628_26800 [Paenibacillus sp. D2_2]
MNRIATVIKMHAKDKVMWHMSWFLILFPFLINVVIGSMLKLEEGYYSGGISSIFIFLLILGILTVTQNFPFAFGFGIRRTDYFIGTILMFALSGIVIATILLLLSLSESYITGQFHVNFHYFHLPYINDGSLFEQWWFYFSTAINLTTTGFAIAMIHRRYGRMGMFIFFPIILVFSLIFSYLCTYFGWWNTIWIWLSSHSAAQLATGLFSLAVIYSLFAFLMIRKTTAS